MENHFTIHFKKNKRVRKAGLCALILVSSICAGGLKPEDIPRTSDQIEIPFELNRDFGLILVRMEINGKAGVLILDTGSNQTIIGSEIANVRMPMKAEFVSTRKGSGYAGKGVFRSLTLRVGPITWSDHPVIVMDMSEVCKSLKQRIDGLLGLDLLNDFAVVVVDSKRHKLVLSR